MDSRWPSKQITLQRLCQQDSCFRSLKAAPSNAQHTTHASGSHAAAPHQHVCHTQLTLKYGSQPSLLTPGHAHNTISHCTTLSSVTPRSLRVTSRPTGPSPLPAAGPTQAAFCQSRSQSSSHTSRQLLMLSWMAAMIWLPLLHPMHPSMRCSSSGSQWM